jgi:hypothetical protein
MSPVRIADHMVANGDADITDAPTAYIAIRYTERTAPMGGYPIGACTPTAMIITAIAKSISAKSISAKSMAKFSLTGAIHGVNGPQTWRPVLNPGRTETKAPKPGSSIYNENIKVSGPLQVRSQSKLR